MKPSAVLAGVDGVLVVTSSPESSSNATTSVNVPPVSMPIRMRRRDVAVKGVKGVKGELVKDVPVERAAEAAGGR